ncbi:MAG: SRPBCC family protein [Pseudomonadota bacterium]
MRLPLIAFAALVASCTSAITPPETPPAYSEPPPLADDGYVTVVTSAEIPMSVSDLRAFLIDRPFITFLEATESISPPVSEQPLSGEWLTPGAVRRLQLADGHYVIERVLENEPELFSYQAWVFTNAAARGVNHIFGEQRFIALSPEQTRFEWTYNVKPKSAVTAFFVRRQVPELTQFMDVGTQAMAAAAAEVATRAD